MVPWVSVGYSRKVIRAPPWHAEPTYAWVAVGTTRVSAPALGHEYRQPRRRWSWSVLGQQRGPRRGRAGVAAEVGAEQRPGDGVQPEVVTEQAETRHGRRDRGPGVGEDAGQLKSGVPGGVRLLVRGEGVRPDGDPRDVADVVVEKGPEIGGRGGDSRRADDQLRRIRRRLLRREEDRVPTLRVSPENGGCSGGSRQLPAAPVVG